MTFKTVDLHRRVAVATDTEIIFALSHATGLFTSMAIDAFLETVFLGSNTFNYRLIALMHQQFHVIAAHVVVWLYTMLTFNRLGDRRLGHAIILGLGFRPGPSQSGGRQDDRAHRQEAFHLASHA